MHDIASLITTQEAEADEDFLEDEENKITLIAAAIIGGAEISRQIRIENRHENRLYLCRPQLLPNPRLATPWQVLYDSQNDHAFITTMGFDVQTFAYILTSGFATCWHETAIPRNDTSTVANPRPEW
ncbi:hypothetical protein PAXRUDRAFT_772156 [Paxillus rubicundulus Ve08.2h10]|uniref:Uncharacterized protein n=1 Tax=Paxillus rubicundulus Ve08.2h10 TaxID=930991 RepID=A0A0D0E4V9_9AGAM|nr:hypothetical protein PAXRUDRAFT_772156 [Paxillus rubicundulus Ve08.2h10]